MVFERKRESLVLTNEDTTKLRNIQSSEKEPYSRVMRAKILIAYAQDTAIYSIAKDLQVSRHRVERCIDKALMGGIDFALEDLPRSGKPAAITVDAKAWVVQLACTKPKELGYPHEFWSFGLLAKHVQRHAMATEHPSLQKAGKSLIHKILKEHDIRPHKISSYLSSKDPEFEEKMAQILVVYKEVEEINEGKETTEHGKNTLTFSYDAKPGIQALSLKNPDLPPQQGNYKTYARDYEYVRHGTLSLLAGINLHTGHILGLVRDRHRSVEFIEFLTLLDSKYTEGVKLRLVLDNHSSHTSKETLRWLKKHPNRFEFVFTPTHASWLNIIEVFFSKMTRTFLRGIRVKSKEELTLQRQISVQ